MNIELCPGCTGCGTRAFPFDPGCKNAANHESYSFKLQVELRRPDSVPDDIGLACTLPGRTLVLVGPTGNMVAQTIWIDQRFALIDLLRFLRAEPNWWRQRRRA